MTVACQCAVEDGGSIWQRRTVGSTALAQE